MEIVMYGADWCRDCRRSKAYLDSKGIEYTYHSLDKEPELADEVVRLNEKAGLGQLKRIPVIVIAKDDSPEEHTNSPRLRR